MTSDLLVFLRGKNFYLASRPGEMVALILDEDAGPIESAANGLSHVTVVF